MPRRAPEEPSIRTGSGARGDLSRAASVWLVAALASWGCAAARPAGLASPPTPARPSDDAEIGLASWYGEFHHGHPTASGETFDMGQFTAAHRALPIGTVLRVRNLENGRVVRVRVNDRGPYVTGRVVDLSYEAARTLDMVERGVVRVRLEVVEHP